SPARPHALFGLLALGVLACTGPPPEVVIETRVGEQQARREREAASETAVSLARATREWWDDLALQRSVAPIDPDADPDPEAEPDASKPAAELRYQPSPPREHDQLDAQVLALREGPLDEVGLITRNLAQAGPPLWPEIRELLLAERKRSKREY